MTPKRLMRHLIAASLILPAFGWLGCNLLIGLDEGHPGDLCEWLGSKDNCVSQLYGKLADPTCGRGDGEFPVGNTLATCTIHGGRAVTFDPPIDPTKFPPTTPTQIKFLSSDGAQCGLLTYEEPFSFSVSLNGANDGPATTLSLAHDVGTNDLSVSCPSSGTSSEPRRFNLGQDALNGCPHWAEFIPQAVLELTPSSSYHPGSLRLAIHYPPRNLDSASTPPGASGPPAPPEVLYYFDCSFPALVCPTDGIKNGSEIDVDCGGPESMPGCPARCTAGQLCNDECDCDSKTTCVPDPQTSVRTCLADPNVPMPKKGACSSICANNVKDGTEASIDCGGVCPLCADGSACGKNADCKSDSCSLGKCVTATCSDQAPNGSESDIDCGGVCSGCSDGQNCNSAADCKSQGCFNGVCSPCANGMKDGTETDADCGGATCAACAEGKSCASNNDCLTKVCTGGKCNGCSNATKDDKESDVDCGGAYCPKCTEGNTCMTGSDCLSSGCLDGKCSQCADGVQDGTESDIDCGGGNCPKCATGKNCVTTSDCATDVCEGFTCGACFDGIKNGTESDIDCGGACMTKCHESKSCTENADCQYNVCVLPPPPDGGPQKPGICNTCTNLLLDGSETDPDCGGSCPKCMKGHLCKSGLDCASGICVGQICQ
jgi:hypothetical protein